MIDKDRIKLMTKIAIHEKRYNNKDRKINEYYRNDYVYKKNATNRISILLGLCFISLLILLDMIYVKHVDIITLDYKSLGIKFGLIFFGIFVSYAVVGIFKYGKEYDESQKRYKRYFSMLNNLDKRSAAPKEDLKDRDGGSHERDFSD